jgi:hypothetical protein
MWRHPALKVILILYIGWGAWNWFSDRPVHPQDGVLAPADPRQESRSSSEKIPMRRWTLTVRASYRITARILALERYHFDSLADHIPEDLALGWGPMSDNQVLKSIDISQSDRFYFWRTSAHSPIARDVIISHSANTHVIPENSSIARQLAHLRPGEVITLTGELVDAVRDDGRWIKTSLVRTDTGAGSCEVLLVQDVAVAP